MTLFSPRLLSRICSLSRIHCYKRISSQVNRENVNSTEIPKDLSTSFGFEQINSEEKDGKVLQLFSSVAGKYDTMNDLLSLGVHRVWKDIFIERLGPTSETELLDVAGGTGDIAFRFLNYFQTLNDENNRSKVTVLDMNEEMLHIGKEKTQKLKIPEDRISWVQGNAESLPFPDNSYSAYTIAFGVRNVTHIDKVLDEAYRVLKPGGRFMCLEFSQVNNEVVRKFYDLYSFQLIPVIGQVVAGDWKSYQYLVESIRMFPTQENFKSMIQKAGFWNVTYENLTFGIVAIHSGFKL